MKKRGHSRLIVFGRRAVQEALEQDEETLQVEEVYAAVRLPAALRKELGARARLRGASYQAVPADEVHAISQEPRHDQGVAARVRLKRLQELETFVELSKGERARGPIRLMALDGVTNSQNIGMIVRSIVATGMGGMVWPLTGSPWINGLVIKASAAAIYRCKILRCDTLAEGLWGLQAAGFALVGLAGEATGSLFDFELPHRVVFVVGSETAGISPEIEALLDTRLSIPIGSGVESLNVAVAASLACFRGAGMIESPSGDEGADRKTP